MEPDAAEIRVLGCLIEKQRTTPDVYPLTMNALRLACNQSTNRDPVVHYDEATIRAALDRLVRRKWATLASWSNRRAMKYRHTLDRELGLGAPELALLCVMMLRGPETPVELKTRSERLHPFDGLDGLHETLDGLMERGLAEKLDRRPGQREERYAQLLGGLEDEEPAPVAEPTAPVAQPSPTVARPPSPPSAPEPATGRSPALAERVEELERELARLRSDLEALRDDLGA
ncbi:MAG TPA: YceH family protein [Thermoleophilaceae bacterium]|nr:YceH family protein [Thermoleophilaceae bacterium]